MTSRSSGRTRWLGLQEEKNLPGLCADDPVKMCFYFYASRWKEWKEERLLLTSGTLTAVRPG